MLRKFFLLQKKEIKEAESELEKEKYESGKRLAHEKADLNGLS